MSEPLAKSILLCNFALQDNLNRWTLVAVFNNVFLAGLPSAIPPFFAFVQVADAPTKGRFVFQVEDPTGIVLWTSGAQVFVIDEAKSHAPWVGVWQVPAVMVTTFGKHRLAFYINADKIVDTELLVTSTSEKIQK